MLQRMEIGCHFDGVEPGYDIGKALCEMRSAGQNSEREATTVWVLHISRFWMCPLEKKAHQDQLSLTGEFVLGTKLILAEQFYEKIESHSRFMR